jgi:hypothetical protein
VRTHERSELCQLEHFYEDLKERYAELIERGDIDAARELLERRLLPLRRILLHEEWNVI